jgi:membrane fusion protein, multidrug efflux system
MKTILYPMIIFFMVSIAFPIYAEAAGAKNPARVTAAPVENENLVIEIKTVGRLAPDIAELSFKIPGRLVELNVDTGDTVKKGEILARLETDDAMDMQKNSKLLMEQAERKFNRIKNLHEKKSVTTDNFEDARDAYHQTKIANHQAKLNVKRCTLAAPCNGKVLKRHLDYMTSVTPGTTIYSFRNCEKPWIVKTNLADHQAFLLKEDSPARVTFSPYPKIPLEGRVTSIAQEANPGDGLYEVEITIIPEKDMLLKPGLLAKVDISRKSREAYSIVPLAALLNLRGMDGHLFVVDKDNNRAVKKEITVRSISGTRVALEEDLSAFEFVITHGNHQIDDADPIEIDE